MPRVSVIIPTFNREQFVVKAIESVLNQSFNDYELIVVDDGSTDNTASALKRFSDRIRYIRQSNSGVGAARNAGIESAVGEWVAFLDSDDEWTTEYLAKQMDCVGRNPGICVQTANCLLTRLNGEGKTYFETNGILREFKGRDYLFLRSPFRFVIDHRPWQVGATIVVRDSIRKAGMFDTSVRISEDLDLMARLALQSGGLGLIREVLVNIYRRDESIKCLTRQAEEDPVCARESDERIYEKLARIEVLKGGERKTLIKLMGKNRRAIGNLLLRQGQPKEARESYKRSFQICPSLWPLGRYFGSFFAANGSKRREANQDVTEVRGHERDPNERHLATDHLLEDLRGRTISSAFTTILSQGFQFVLSMGSIVVLARLLDPADFGFLAMAMTVLAFLRVFKDVGLSTATVQSAEITHAQVSNLFWINVAFSAFMTLLMAGSAPIVAWFFREPHLVSLILVLSPCFLLTGLAVQHTALMNRQMRFKALAVIQISSQIMSAAVGIVMAWVGYGYWSLAAAQLTLPLVALLLTWSFSDWRPQLPTRNSGVRRMVGFGANLTLASFFYSIAAGMDSLLIARLHGATPLGLYTRALALMRRPLDQLLSPINAVCIPALSRLQGQPERYRRSFFGVYEVVILATMLFSALLAPLSRELTLVILGPNWEEATVIVAAFTIAALCHPIGYVCGWLFESQGRGGDALRTSFFNSGLGIAAIFIGLPFGAAGVAISISAVNLFLQLPINFYMVGRAGAVNTREIWGGFLRQLPVWGVVSTVTFVAHLVTSGQSPAVQLFLCIPIGLLAGAGFIALCAPNRRTVVFLVDAIIELKNGRRSSLPTDKMTLKSRLT